MMGDKAGFRVDIRLIFKDKGELQATSRKLTASFSLGQIAICGKTLTA